jgi:hypothetical protein
MRQRKIFDYTTVGYFATVAMVKQHEKKLHWQNAFVGNVRQVLVVHWRMGIKDSYTSILDNDDGSGLAKIESGWWPNMPHREIEIVEEIKELYELPEREWNQFNPLRYQAINAQVETYQEQRFAGDPDYEGLKNLKAVVKGGKL